MGLCGSFISDEEKTREEEDSLTERLAQKDREALAAREARDKKNSAELQQAIKRGEADDGAGGDGKAIVTPLTNGHGGHRRSGSRSHSSRSRSRSRSKSKSSKRRKHRGPSGDTSTSPILANRALLMDAVKEEQRQTIEISHSNDPVGSGGTPLPRRSSSSANNAAASNAAGGGTHSRRSSANPSPPHPLSRNLPKTISDANTNSHTDGNTAASSSSSSSIHPHPNQQSASVQQAVSASMQSLDCVVVLVCEEDATIQRSLEKWLSHDRAYQLVPVESGDEAQEVLATAEVSEENIVQDISFIILQEDMITPSGESLFTWIVENPILREIPLILICSEGTSTQASERLLRRGATDVLIKPLNSLSILNSIDTLFRTKIDSRKIEFLRDAGDQYKEELRKERMKLRAVRSSVSSNNHTISSSQNTNTLQASLSPFTVSSVDPSSHLDTIHMLLIDSSCSYNPSTGASLSMSKQSESICEWIGSMILNIIVTASCHDAGRIIEEMNQNAVMNNQQQMTDDAGQPQQQQHQQGPQRHTSQNSAGGTIMRALGSNTSVYTLLTTPPTSSSPAPTSPVAAPSSSPSHLSVPVTAGGTGTRPSASSAISESPSLNTASLDAVSGASVDASSGSSSSASASASTSYRTTSYGIECICFDYSIIEPLFSSSEPHSHEEEFKLKQQIDEISSFIAIILKQFHLIPLIILIDESLEVSSRLLQPFAQCSVTFIHKPLGKDLFRSKIGLLIESIQANRVKLKYAKRAQEYRLMLGRIREKKKVLGLDMKMSLPRQQNLEQQPHHGSLVDIREVRAQRLPSASYDADQQQQLPRHADDGDDADQEDEMDRSIDPTQLPDFSALPPPN